MKPYCLLSLFCILLSSICFGQTKDYWVFYNKKNCDTTYIQTHFDIKSITRRQHENITFNESDLPVDIENEQKVSALASDFLGSTKWFNASYVKATDSEINQISSLPFVAKVSEAQTWQQNPVCTNNEYSKYNSKEILRSQQISMFYPEPFYEKGFTGKGIRIAILDAGFPSVNTHSAFKHLRDNKQIIDTYDFIKNERYAFRGHSHGTMVLSCVAGLYLGEKMGLAQDAEFLLARTEKSFEPFKEEIFWLRAMEWADEKGADLINSSLGYTYHRYFQSDMDGKTSLITRAANMAAHKGILVVNAAGNEGTDEWHVIGTPADADSILSIGGVEPDSKLHISFSSFGPTADGRLKPNLSASGEALVAAKNGGFTSASGTSFASPLTCGFAACAKQAFPDLTVMELKAKLESCGSLYPYFDYAHGYGIPDARKLFQSQQNKNHIELSTEKDILTISISNEYMNNMNIHNQAVLFYHILNQENMLEEYKVIQIFQRNVVTIPLHKLEGKTLQVHFNGSTTTKEF